MKLGTWRASAITLAEGHNAENIVDGTTRGNRYVGQVLFPLGGNPEDPDYRNGKTAWCGRFLEAVFRPLGFPFSLDSVGRVLSYAHYNEQYRMEGAPDHCVYDDVLSLRDYHYLYGGADDGRRVVPAWSPNYTPLPGDIALHQKEPGSWHGHVMMVLGVDAVTGAITVIEGNHSATTGPSGRVRDGIGTRVIDHGDPYLDWIVVPSDLDFDPTLEIGSKAQLATQC